MKRKTDPTARFRVFGLGQCSLDSLGRIDAFPRPDAKCECPGRTVQGGGPVAAGLVVRPGALSQAAFIVAEPSRKGGCP